MSIAATDFDYVKDLIRKQAGITLDGDKRALVESRLTGLCMKEGLAGLEDLFHRLRAEKFSPLHVRLVESMTTNETLFFRDGSPFEGLRKKVLPDLIAKRRAEKKLRIFSAACSTGQEPYSIAMLIHENFQEVWGWDLKIFAADYSKEMIVKAKQGRYSQFEVSRGLPENYRNKYFQQRGDAWQISSNIQSKVEFQTLNLAGAWHLGDKFDVIFLRNVMIYFDWETKKGILNRIHGHLKPDGALFLGTAETYVSLDARFKMETFEKALYYSPQR
jgi:chemotaxis protein methyltransferase CheR